MIQSVNLQRLHAEIEDDLMDAVRRVLRHGHYILGPEVQEFEEKMAEFLDVGQVVGVNSGTDALILALRAHGIGEGDEVITVSHSYVATASAIALRGATPVFVDIDEDTMLMDPELLSPALTERTRAVMPVHLNGYPCDLSAIQSFCEANRLALIEDCAQAIGATFFSQKVGSFGTGCFSLHPIKALGACGDGGFIATSDATLAADLREFRTIGHRDRDHVVSISGNSRLDTLQAALLLVKLKHLPNYIARRRELAARYRSELPDTLRAMPSHDDREGVYAQYVVRHPSRRQLLDALGREGIDAKVHYPIPIHRQPAFQHFDHDALPVTERVVDEIVSLPLSYELTDAEHAKVVRVVNDVLPNL